MSTPVRRASYRSSAQRRRTGAALTPPIASLLDKRSPPTYLFLVLAAVLMVTLLFIRKNRAVFAAGLRNATQSASGFRHRKLLSAFAMIGFLYVRTEVPVSGWMMTYFGRLPISTKPGLRSYIRLLDRAYLRARACTGDHAMVVRGATSYVIINDGLHRHLAAHSQLCTACSCLQRRGGWLDACADISSLPGRGSQTHAKFARIKVDLCHLGRGGSNSTVDNRSALCSQ